MEVLCSCPCLSVLQIINDMQLLVLLNRAQEVERSKLKLLLIIIVFQKKKKKLLVIEADSSYAVDRAAGFCRLHGD